MVLNNCKVLVMFFNVWRMKHGQRVKIIFKIVSIRSVININRVNELR